MTELIPLPLPLFLQLDGINLFAILSIISIFYCLPCALVIEGARWNWKD